MNATREIKKIKQMINFPFSLPFKNKEKTLIDLKKLNVVTTTLQNIDWKTKSYSIQFTKFKLSPYLLSFYNHRQSTCFGEESMCLSNTKWHTMVKRKKMVYCFQNVILIKSEKHYAFALSSLSH